MTIPSLCDISLDEGGRQCKLAAEVFSEQRGKLMYDNQASEYTCDSSVFIGRESEGGTNGNDSWRYVVHGPISQMEPTINAK